MTPRDHIQEQVAKVIRETVPMHTGGNKTADAVIDAVADEIDTYGKRFMDEAIRRVKDDEPGGFNAVLRAATVSHVAKYLRGAAAPGAVDGSTPVPMLSLPMREDTPKEGS